MAGQISPAQATLVAGGGGQVVSGGMDADIPVLQLEGWDETSE